MFMRLPRFQEVLEGKLARRIQTKCRTIHNDSGDAAMTAKYLTPVLILAILVIPALAAPPNGAPTLIERLEKSAEGRQQPLHAGHPDPRQGGHGGHLRGSGGKDSKGDAGREGVPGLRFPPRSR